MSEPPIKCQTVYWHCITMDTTPLWPCALTRRPWLCLHLHVLRCDCCSSTNPLTGNESVWGHVGRYYSYLAKSGGSDNVEAHAMVKHTSLINTEFHGEGSTYVLCCYVRESSVLTMSRQSDHFSIVEKCKKKKNKTQTAGHNMATDLTFWPRPLELPEDWSTRWYTWLVPSSHVRVVLNLILVLTQQTPSLHSSNG